MIPNERLDELAAMHRRGDVFIAKDDNEFAALIAQCREANRLREAIQKIDLTLRIPAAEYVPAIGDVFEIIDSLKGTS